MTRKKMKMVKQSELTYAGLFDEFIRHKKNIGLAEETINAYTYNHKYLGQFIDGKHELVKDLEPALLINEYKHHLRED